MKPVQTVLMIDDDVDDQKIFRDVLHEIEETMAHERLSSIPVVMYTTSVNNVQQEKAKILGASDVITKPSDINLLMQPSKQYFSRIICITNWLRSQISRQAF